MCFQGILQILRNFNMWLIKYEVWKRTAHNVQFKCMLPLDKWSHYYVVFVIIKEL